MTNCDVAKSMHKYDGEENPSTPADAVAVSVTLFYDDDYNISRKNVLDCWALLDFDVNKNNII